jgi:hypothetical protein
MNFNALYTIANGTVGYIPDGPSRVPTNVNVLAEHLQPNLPDGIIQMRRVFCMRRA